MWSCPADGTLRPKKPYAAPVQLVCHVVEQRMNGSDSVSFLAVPRTGTTAAEVNCQRHNILCE